MSIIRHYGSTLTAVGRSRLLARWPGTHSRILSVIQGAAQTVLGVYLKRTCSRVTSASSALGVPNDYALYKSTHSLTIRNCVKARRWKRSTKSRTSRSNWRRGAELNENSLKTSKTTLRSAASGASVHTTNVYFFLVLSPTSGRRSGLFNV